MRQIDVDPPLMPGSLGTGPFPRRRRSDELLLCDLMRLAVCQVKAGQWVHEYADRSQVQTFALEMAQAHANLVEELRVLAVHCQLLLLDEAAAQAAEGKSALQELNHAALEQSYLRQHGVVDHESMMKTLEILSQDSSNTAIRNFSLTLQPLVRVFHQSGLRLYSMYSKE
ncbi:MAG: hypothetical protein GAK30_03689 [Paracidovorax wautersii]|uniref:DUF4142 domain-containing protein n=1 Tax=Paracidovorax wautersii TaxID=1177982 RepID=A0A7V8JNX7_9BURK|nr:MAG: hypothetical protein GAK30_03689 [Paracidovorax wautersii]